MLNVNCGFRSVCLPHHLWLYSFTCWDLEFGFNAFCPASILSK